MKHLWLSYTFSVVLLTILGGLLYLFFNPFSDLPKVAFASPLAGPFTLAQNSQVTSLNIWQPSQSSAKSDTNLPNVTGLSIISYDLTSDKVLYEKNAQARLPMASLTKIMTAIVALEHPKSDGKYLVHGSDLVGEDSMGLDTGEVLSLKELLYGLILHSANDAAEVIASNYEGGRGAFITAMNDKAKSLGLTHTHFTNPTGLQGDGEQYTTAEELLIMSKYALAQFPEFADIAATINETIPASATHKEYYLENETNLMTTYPGVHGLKTGLTDEAGLCLVTYLQYGGHNIVAVLLKSQNRRDDMKQILDYSLQSLGITPPPYTGG